MNILQREIERENQERVKLEDEIYQRGQEQLTAEKAADYSSKLRFKLKESTREIVSDHLYHFLSTNILFPHRNVISPK